MSNPRANIGHILTAAGGVLLFLLTFLKWYGPGDGAKPWEIFTLADIAIAFGALAAAGLAAAHLAGAAANLPPQVTSAQRWLGATASLLAIAFIVELVAGEFTFKFGGVLALLAALVLLAGTIALVRPDLAARVEAATANLGAGGGVGAGPGPGPGAGPASPAQPTPAAPASPSPAAPAPAAATPPAPPEPAQPATAPQPAAATPAQPESSGPAAGWYPDPQGQKRLRYWDGGRWTEQTAD